MEKAIGSEAKLKLGLENGKVVLSVVYDGKGLDGEIKLLADSDYFCDELAKLVPGDTVAEQFIIGALKAAFHAAKV
jgi:hypothetical protein